MRILELFSGIGSVSCAVRGTHEIACAIDINQTAASVYAANFDSPVRVREIASISDQGLAKHEAELWWMSPPCQPFTRRGLQRDLNDPRSAALLRLIQAVKTLKPAHIALENVVGFEKSQMHERLTETLSKSGYEFAQLQLCNSQFGLPNLRPRFFLVASLNRPVQLIPPDDTPAKQVKSFLLPSNKLGQFSVLEKDLMSYHHAINVVDSDSRTTRCFTSAYGKSNVRSGSYLKYEAGYRRFAPREVARLIGLPDSFILPEQLTSRQLWKLLGNAVSVPSVRHVLGAFSD
jgi:site-specific DNA-cytosine methylase